MSAHSAGKRTFAENHHQHPHHHHQTPKKLRNGFHVYPLKGNPVQTRRTNDEIHSSIDMGPVVTALVDTPQFQRLRQIKQLGTAEYVYCNTNHNRWEHSLGVAALARRMMERIRTKQPQLPCDGKDVLCVELAGLLHDVGHGPFSHTFEGFLKHAQAQFLRERPAYRQYYYVNEAEKNNHTRQQQKWPLRLNVQTWKHEAVSLAMIDAALAYLGLAVDLHNLDAPLQQIGDGVDARTMRVFAHGTDHDDDDALILTSRDWVFIKECIYGGPIAAVHDNNPIVQKLIGRGPDKEWMYDVVSNGYSGLDVDKMDYFARDQRRAFGTSGQVHIQMIEDCYVARGYGARPGRDNAAEARLMICYGEKIEKSAINFFKERLNLHESIYRHKTVQAVTYMIQDIFCLADPFLPISAKNKFGTANGRQGQAKKEYDNLPMSLAVLDTDVFQRLTDSVIDLIEAKEDVPELDEARALIHRLRRRDLYKCKGMLPISLTKDHPQDQETWAQSSDQIKYELLSIAGVHCDQNGLEHRLEAEDFIVEKCSVHHGSNASNPLNNMRFVQKHDEAALSNSWENLPLAVEFNKKK